MMTQVDYKNDEGMSMGETKENFALTLCEIASNYARGEVGWKNLEDAEELASRAFEMQPENAIIRECYAAILVNLGAHYAEGAFAGKWLDDAYKITHNAILNNVDIFLLIF